MSYREQFSDEQKAQQYEDSQYHLGAYSSVLWEIEKDQLAKLVDEFRRTHNRIDYLDFAAGTGRVIEFMQHRVDSATGIEISPAMAKVAQDKLDTASMICADITALGTPVESTYDIITAFRFVLNAEPELRLAAMKALAARLKDDTSWLIFNNHGNLWSHKLAMFPFHALRNFGSGHRTEGNYMTNCEARKIAEEAGLIIERIIGCGILSAKIAGLLPLRHAVALEYKLARSEMISRIGVNQLYIARLRS
jgi:SAM-dependent methyltransferase